MICKYPQISADYLERIKMNSEKRSEIYGCILRQFPDEGIYRMTRVSEWLATNGYSLEKLGYADFRSLVEDMPEVMSVHPEDGGNTYVIIRRCEDVAQLPESGHPADSFFGSRTLILNDDIIEMSQQSLYALTKVLGNGLSVQEMKQGIYDRFAYAKENNTLSFLGERYTFPIDCCQDGFLVNGIITKNISPRGKSLYFSFEKTAIFSSDSAQLPARSIQNTKNVSAEDRAEIYRLLSAHFPFEEPLHMAAVSKLLTDNHIDRAKYGCFKMKDLLARMDYLTLEDVVLGGVPQIMVTLHRCEELTPAQSVQTAQEQVQPEDESGDIPAQRLEEFCNLPPKPISIVASYLAKRGRIASAAEIREELSEDFEQARSGGIRFYEGKMIFPCRYERADGSPVEITLKRSTYEGKPWFLNYIDFATHSTVTKPVHPGKMLENFAFLGSWSGFLSELADKALPEEWDFANAAVKDHHILIQYIKYTFFRLTKENKISISADKQFAAFNTGLVDRYYDDIYACFTPNDSGGSTLWKFAGFSTAASRGLGKMLVNYFNPLPEPAQYFRRNEDLIFDLAKPLHPDFDHIIIDNLRRLPLQFLSDQLNDSTGAQELITKLRTADRNEKRELYDQLSELIKDNSRLFTRIQNRIKDAIELARKRVRRNYRTAIPSYFPKRDTMSLMLPLCLTDEEHPDVALVVELTPSGNYQGQTILTIPQAYIDARLLCRLSDDWLSTARSSTAADEDMIE